MARYVELHNSTRIAGRFEPLGELFADEAELEFQGILLGPFFGRDAIIGAFGRYPPNDGLLLLEARVISSTEVTATYAAESTPENPAGNLKVAHDSTQILRLIITVNKEG